MKTRTNSAPANRQFSRNPDERTKNKTLNFTLLALIAALLLLASPAQAGNLLVNGSFEWPALATHSYSSVAPTGWAWDNGAGSLINGYVYACCEVAAVWPQDGQQYVALGNMSSSISQSFS